MFDDEGKWNKKNLEHIDVNVDIGCIVRECPCVCGSLFENIEIVKRYKRSKKKMFASMGELINNVVDNENK